MSKPIKIECGMCEEITFVEVVSDEAPHHCPMCGHPVNFESDGYDEEDDY